MYSFPRVAGNGAKNDAARGLPLGLSLRRIGRRTFAQLAYAPQASSRAASTAMPMSALPGRCAGEERFRRSSRDKLLAGGDDARHCTASATHESRQNSALRSAQKNSCLKCIGTCSGNMLMIFLHADDATTMAELAASCPLFYDSSPQHSQLALP